MLIGGEGIPAIAEIGLKALSEAPSFTRLSTETVGDDVLTVFRVRE
jgi:riboflavin biosynthesis pyrimidine reductase